MFVTGSVGMGELVSRNDLYMAWSVQALQGKPDPKYIGVKPSIRPNIAQTVSKLISCVALCAKHNACNRHCILEEQAGTVIGHGERNLIQLFHILNNECIASVEYIGNIFMWKF